MVSVNSPETILYFLTFVFGYRFSSVESGGFFEG